MSKRHRDERHHSSDPRRSHGGDIAGPGGHYDRNSVIIDSSNAVLIESIDTAVVHTTRDGEPAADAFTLLLSGRVHRSPDRVRNLYLTDLEGLAKVAADCITLALRYGADEEFMRLLDGAIERGLER